MHCKPLLKVYNVHDEGKNMDGILDELEMTGIRQGNMLKSLASASDKMETLSVGQIVRGKKIQLSQTKLRNVTRQQNPS